MAPKTPYSDLPSRQFWRTAVADRGPLGIGDLHHASFGISATDKIITAGSCFAQAIGNRLIQRGYHWFDAEPGPPMMRSETARNYNYGVYSARTGNIYTVALLRQWLDWAFAPELADSGIWTDTDGKLRDPLRPAIEPDGFESEGELRAARRRTFAALRRAVREADVFIFTMGGTEAWSHKETGMIFPMCPGVLGGEFDPAQHELNNFFYDRNLEDLGAVIELLKLENPKLRVILTVSPVPITATAVPDSHVLVANTYAKSILRALAGEAAHRWDYVDYFPSYELLASPSMRGMFYNANQRTIAPAGVDFVMQHFFESYLGTTGSAAAPDRAKLVEEDTELQCDEMLLDFYNGR